MKQDKDTTLDAIVSELKETIYSLNIEDVRMNDVLSKFDNKVAINKKASKGLGFIFAFLMISLVSALIGVCLLLDRTDALESKISTLEYRDSLFTKFMEPDSASIITYRVKNGEPVTYHQLEKEKDSLEQKYYDLESLKEHYRIQLSLVTRNYPITFKNNGNEYSIQALKIDSALQLLEVYRDMIEYNPQRREWIVTRYK